MQIIAPLSASDGYVEDSNRHIWELFILAVSHWLTFLSFTMASDQGSNEKKRAYDSDVRSLEGQVASPEVHTTLHRKLKNRHVAMIRYILLPRITITYLRFQYWWCHWHRSLPRISILPDERRSRRYSLGLHIHWNDMFRHHGLRAPTSPMRLSSYISSQLSLGEMTAFLPLPGGFIKLAERFIDPAYAFATGWNYWYGWTVRTTQRRI